TSFSRDWSSDVCSSDLNVGPAYGKILIACPLNWRSDESMTTEILQAAVNSCFFPLYEIEKGKTRITYDPEPLGLRVPVREWAGRSEERRVGKACDGVRA